MLFLNKFLLHINIALVVINLLLHQPGWALLAAACIYLNISTIKKLENLDDKL